MKKVILKNKEDYLDFICENFGEAWRKLSYEQLYKIHKKPSSYPCYIWIIEVSIGEGIGIFPIKKVCFKTIGNCFLEVKKAKRELRLLFTYQKK